MRSIIKSWTPPRILDLYRRLQRSESAGAAGVYRGFKIPERSIESVFPGIFDNTLQFPASQLFRRRDMVMPHTEVLLLAAMCQHVSPEKIFEFGTYTGSTTFLMAMNVPPSADIFTLDLDPKARLIDANDQSFQPGSAFKGSREARRITQLYGDSTTFDYSPYLALCDLVLVDANHSYEFVKADTKTALKLIRPGGTVIWDDYLWEEQWPECAGVTQCVDELLSTHDVFQISGTRLAAYRDVSRDV